MDLAIVGLALCGRTSVFNALTAGHGQAATRGERLGVVRIPDERLEKLAALVGAKKVTAAELRLHDLPPIFERGAAPSGEAAESLARADALIHVVRAFHRDDVPHPQGSVDPHRDIAAFEAELLLHVLGIVERRLEKLDITVRSARPGEREAGEREQHLLQRVRQHLESDRPLREQSWSADDLKGLANYGLLSLKPLLVLLNIDESDAAGAAAIEADLRARYGDARLAAAAMCARLEAELAELSPEDAAEFRRELEGGDTPAQRVLRLAQEVLGLVTFYTPVGEECRAWPVPAGTTALQAAGRIHTDMERGFIRAEAIAWEKLMEMGSLAEAKKHGALRTEGKGYAVQDGDVLHILFHV
ncbi:MAG: redox-regulated ATPase YchF [Chloroflexi bacterium]|nr:redox-regulated ATPase YchF [Chloroflexota bacterium]